MRNKIMMAGLTLFLSGCGFSIVDTGEVALEKCFGEIKKVVKSGSNWHNPVGCDLIKVDLKAQELTGKTVSYTKDIQTAEIDYKGSYSINEAAVLEVYTYIGENWEHKLIVSLIEESLKEVIGTYEAVQLIEKRSEASAKIRDTLQAKIDSKAKKEKLTMSPVVISSFALNDISYSDIFEKAVEAKVVATQAAEQKKNETVQVQEEVKQSKIRTDHELTVMKQRAEAIQQDPKLLFNELIVKWDGKLPTNLTVVVDEETGKMLNLPAK
jgi:prohibitin 2